MTAHLISAGPSAKHLDVASLRGDVFCVNYAAKVHRCDWFCYHDRRVYLETVNNPRKGYISSHDVVVRDFGTPDSCPAGLNFVETVAPWNNAFNFTFPIMLATILKVFNPEHLTVHGVDMVLAEDDCAGTKSKTRIDPNRWEMEFKQIEKVWSPACSVAESCQMSNLQRDLLKIQAEINGVWHDRKRTKTTGTNREARR